MPPCCFLRRRETDMVRSAPILRVAIAGLGAVGLEVAAALGRGIPGCGLAAVSAADLTRAAERLTSLGLTAPAVTLAELALMADIVVECVPAALLSSIAVPFLDQGKAVMVLSTGALLTHAHLIDLARSRGGRIIVPTGALPGLDAVLAAAEGTIRSVRMVTRKPVRGLLGAPYLESRGISLERLAEPLCVFRGTPREAAIGFPANLNVAVALSLAGIGPDRTALEIWVDPSLDRNIHHIDVEADSANFSMTIENIPSDNPRTGRITALSVIAALRKLHAPLAVGT